LEMRVSSRGDRPSMGVPKQRENPSRRRLK
jgi:hypothetical protein